MKNSKIVVEHGFAPAPVLFFIHGAFSTSRSWSVHQPYLLNHLHSETKSCHFTYDIVQQHLTDLADNLAEEVNVVAEMMPNVPINLIGHSFGGVIAMTATTRLKGLENKVKVISLASPFGGVDHAWIGSIFNPCSVLLHNISSNNSELLKLHYGSAPGFKLHNMITTAGGLPTIKKPNDTVVTIESQEALINRPNVTHEHVPVNHFEILLDSHVSKRLVELVH